MSALMEPAALRSRILDWAKEEEDARALMSGSARVLAPILVHGQLQRKDAAEVTGADQRKARRMTSLLDRRGIIAAPTHKAPFRIAFPAALAPRLMPGLYPRLPGSS